MKLIRSLRQRVGDGVDLLIFNTHGESLGRGGMQAPMADRQAWLMTPYVRYQAVKVGVGIYHQSSFQGGDGYRLFGTAGLAESTMRGLLAAEAASPGQNCADDAFYQKTDFSLDLFLELKAWHEALVAVGREEVRGAMQSSDEPRSRRSSAELNDARATAHALAT